MEYTFCRVQSILVSKKIQAFRQKVKAWNKLEVKNIKQIEKKKIDEIQGYLMIDPFNISLQKKNVNLSRKLGHLVKLEEIKWAQKSREAWTQLGDENNRYFQTLALNIRRKNRI